MAATALTQEKVWLDKSSYDNAERLHFERLAKLGTYCKLLSNNSMDQCSPDSVFADPQNQINSNPPPNARSKKSKKNKSPVQQDKGLDIVPKNPKCQAKNAKIDKKGEKCLAEKTECAEKIDKVESKAEEAGLVSEDAKKYKPKEAKEKKNKADKKHRNKEEVKQNAKEQADHAQTLNQGSPQSTIPILPASGSLANEVAKARQHIKQSLQCMDGITELAGGSNGEILSRLSNAEKDNQDLKNIIHELVNTIARLEDRVKSLEEGGLPPSLRIAVCPAKPEGLITVAEKAAPKKDDDDDVDLFGSESEGEDEEAAKIREERLAAYAAKKTKKPALIAKSNIILDVKPWDDETDMKAMEAEVRKITTDGLLWGAAKLVPLAYGIHKLQISSVVEDDKVSIDWLTEQIEAIEDFVQSVDIAAFNKV